MTMLVDLRLAAVAGLPLVDDADIDWEHAHELTYVLHQRVRYTYTTPACDLRQRMMLVPPARHGDQMRLAHGVTTDATNARLQERLDNFGNVVTDIRVEAVPATIEFDAWTLLTRQPTKAPPHVPSARRLLRPSRLTEPDAYLADAAASLAGRRAPNHDTAEAICEWVWRTMRYEFGATDIGTTAADAIALGRGVCQDFAHVMVALCRLAGMPARYVSGHLLGEGGSHAWVEVLLPARRGGGSVAYALDPTHGDRTSTRHLTVAVGRDYTDVAPVSGTCVTREAGQMHVTKRAGVAAIEYAA
jgi:transglutaminase-like putative cysteine protease